MILVEVMKPIKGLQVIVEILEIITGKDYKYLLEQVPKVDKNGKKYNAAVWCIHHQDVDLRNLESTVIIKVSDHNKLHSKEKFGLDDIPESDKVYAGKIICDALRNYTTNSEIVHNLLGEE